MTKIFTFGSCISRDIFNHTPEGEFEVTLNIQRMSFALMPLEGFPLEYEELDLEYLDDFPWEVKMMVTEVSKKCLDMAKEADADYLVMDLIEERFDFAEFTIGGKTYRCVKTGQFENYYKKYLKDKASAYRELSINGYTDGEVKEYFEKSINEILKRFSIDKIILIETYYAEKMADDEGNITEYENMQEIKATNKRLERVYGIMKNILSEHSNGGKNYYLIKCGDNMGYKNHKWGAFPAHYTDDFYVNAGNIIREYCNIGKTGN